MFGLRFKLLFSRHISKNSYIWFLAVELGTVCVLSQCEMLVSLVMRSESEFNPVTLRSEVWNTWQRSTLAPAPREGPGSGSANQNVFTSLLSLISYLLAVERLQPLMPPGSTTTQQLHHLHLISAHFFILLTLHFSSSIFFFFIFLFFYSNIFPLSYWLRFAADSDRMSNFSPLEKTGLVTLNTCHVQDAARNSEWNLRHADIKWYGKCRK